MPTSLELRFPWGRYHANPWGRHVNEAAIEWPPSPWRLLRGLYATWMTRAPDLSDDTTHPVLEVLATPPTFFLPEWGEAHTRHYMPDKDYAPGNGGGKDKAFDAFAVIARDARVIVSWPVVLSGDQQKALDRLAHLLPYLGRAESVCEARLMSTGERFDGLPSEPVTDEMASSFSIEDPTVRVLVPRAPLDIEALTARTTQVRGAGLLDPSGARWQLYTVPERPSRIRPRRPIAATKPTAVRFAMVGPASASNRAAVAMGDVFRRACLARFGRRFDGAVSRILAGKEPGGEPLTGHGHTHYLAIDADQDGFLDHMIAWSPSGFDEGDLQSLTDLRRLTGFGHVSDFRPARLAIEAFGPVEQVTPELVGPAAVWRSFTPFAPGRHAKRRQRWQDLVLEQVRTELAWRGFPDPLSVEAVGGDWLTYRRHRIRERLEDSRRAIGVRIAFAEPIPGPIALGALSHFGLGLFLPKNEE